MLLCSKLGLNFAGKRLFRHVGCANASNLPPSLIQYLETVKLRHRVLGSKLENPNLSPAELRVTGKKYSELSQIVALLQSRADILDNINGCLSIEKEEGLKGKDGEEFVELARAEREEAQAQLIDLEKSLLKIIIPSDDDDNANSAVLEVRAGTGGDEASLFASEIFGMYEKFSKLKGWKWELLTISKNEVGGFKEAQASMSGDSVFKLMKFEAGVHRVQRIPFNDVKIQTSASSVIVMPEPEDIEIDINPKDVRIDVFRSSGAGGQSVNKTESAVRMTHIPTGLVVSMQDERSQIQNRARAMKILKAKVYDLERRRQMAMRKELRSLSQGTGDRSDKIRTYNFPQDRVTDHRANFTMNGVERVLDGEALDEILDALAEADEKVRIESFLESLELNGGRS